MPDIDPPVVRVLREYREAIGAKDIALQQNLARGWLTVERRLDSDIAALAYEIDRRRATGQEITEQIVWRNERYKILKARLEDEIARYNLSALNTIEQQQREFGWIGLNASRDALMASVKDRIAPFFPVLDRDAVEFMVGNLGNGKPLGSLLRRDFADALAGITDALINGIARGYSPAQVAREMVNGASMGLDRAILIARTEVNRAYRTAAVMQYRSSSVVSGFMRLVKKETACLACLMLDGERFDLERELDDHPNGKCVAVPVVIGVDAPRWETGGEWFASLDAEDQRRLMGEERYNLWTSGAFNLRDLARKTHSDEWGDAPRVATLAELRGEK